MEPRRKPAKESPKSNLAKRAPREKPRTGWELIVNNVFRTKASLHADNFFEPSGAEPVVAVQGLSKGFRREDGTRTTALDDVSFTVQAGEFVVLLGPSGCGKTTLLRCIAGLETPDSGEVTIRGRVCFSSYSPTFVPTERRGISMIFQSYALWPHMTVFDNIAYALRTPRRGERRAKSQIDAAVHQVLQLVGIPELAKQFPGKISGGQQQRVALARALVAGTGLILFDEPLSNVDAKVRDTLRAEIVTMQKELGFAAIYVTHDQDEAMAMADRIAVLGSGRILQLAAPREIYRAPISLEVARFVGKTNELEGAVADMTNGKVVVDTALGAIRVDAGELRLSPGDPVVVTWRPENSQWHTEQPAAENCFEGVIVREVFLGPTVEYHLKVADREFRLWQPTVAPLDFGDRVWMSVQAKHLRAIPLNEPSTSTPSPFDRQTTTHNQ
jgi:iron(III) transport system ATP-binding protein